MKRLTPEQQQLVTEHMGLANYIAKGLCQNEYSHRDPDEMYSAAMWGLCIAAREWNGVGKFLTFAFVRAKLRAVDALRGVCGRQESSKYQMGQAFQFSLNSDGEPGEWDIDNGEQEIGWELESEDEVRGKLKYLDKRSQRRMLSMYLDASYSIKKLAEEEDIQT